MNSNLLPVPTPKRRCNFEHSHPFPIIPKDDRSNATTAWKGSSKSKWKCFTGELKEDCVIVCDDEAIKALFSMGFFGKGTLSKRTPRVCRPERSTAEGSGKSSTDSSDNEDVSPENMEVEDNAENVKAEANAESSDSSSFTTSSSSDSEDDNTVAPTCEVPTEKLQLTFEEAFFLSYGLGCLIVKDGEQPLSLLKLWEKLCERSSDASFPIMYTAYHHFRSKGWVVRSGLKYGADFVLYKDGPPFYHSTYAVIVKPVKEKRLKDIDPKSEMSWSELLAAHRVNSHVAKAIMLLYVIKPEVLSDYKVSTPFCVSQFKLQEVIIKRWVPSAGREDDT